MPLHLKPKALDFALKHLRVFGDTDIFPLPFEYDAIESGWLDTTNSKGKTVSGLRTWLSNQDYLNWIPRSHRRCLSPKHHFGFRVSTQLDPLDTLVYTALVLEIGFDLERVRVPPSKNIVHSFRFKPTPAGNFYDARYGYDSFHAASMLHAEQHIDGYVVFADIADFYPRLYSHPLENALAAATPNADHVIAIKKLLKGWNYHVSYGIPVGPSASRLLAEVAIADVDAALLGEGYAFVRFVDDYRIFVSSERDAFQALAFLANVLFENHGLTLQQHKTYIASTESFVQRNEVPDSIRERDSLTRRFEAILTDLGISNWYEPIEYEDLDKATKDKIDALNLQGLFREQLDSEDALDIPTVRFVLRRLGQIDDMSAIASALDNMKRLYPVFKDVIEYVRAMRSLSAKQKATVGAKLLRLIDNDIVGHLEYHRAWILSLFTKDREWNNEAAFVRILDEYHDEFTQREAILALGRSGKSEWFKARKRSFGAYAGWVRRAFLAAASCMPGDEAEFWYRSVSGQLDPLEDAVVKWIRSNRFG